MCSKVNTHTKIWKPQNFISYMQIYSLSQHNSQPDQPHISNRGIIIYVLIFWIFSIRMFETTRECTLTKDFVYSMITISENATPMTTMKWILGAIVRSKGISIFHFLTLVICNTSTISVKVKDIFKLIFNILTHPFGNKYSLKLIPNSQKISKFTKILSRVQ